eukprot:scaffold7377_cov257-Pinguiococcus_pyrenoidosus.AAC.7
MLGGVHSIRRPRSYACEAPIACHLPRLPFPRPPPSPPCQATLGCSPPLLILSVNCQRARSNRAGRSVESCSCLFDQWRTCSHCERRLYEVNATRRTAAMVDSWLLRFALKPHGLRAKAAALPAPSLGGSSGICPSGTRSGRQHWTAWLLEGTTSFGTWHGARTISSSCTFRRPSNLPIRRRPGPMSNDLSRSAKVSSACRLAAAWRRIRARMALRKRPIPSKVSSTRKLVPQEVELCGKSSQGKATARGGVAIEIL